jgi:hypothetical protein
MSKIKIGSRVRIKTKYIKHYNYFSDDKISDKIYTINKIITYGIANKYFLSKHKNVGWYEHNLINMYQIFKIKAVLKIL